MPSFIFVTDINIVRSPNPADKVFQGYVLYYISLVNNEYENHKQDIQ